MVANYLKVAIRNLTRNKTFSAINILGLAIGMACCLLILLYVQDELSYDRHHENAGRIYRLAEEARVRGETRRFALSSYPMGPALVQDYPAVLDAVRFRRFDEELLVTNGRDRFYERGVLFADSNVLQVFDFPLSKGEPQSAFQEPNSIILTKAMARKYYDEDDPMGQSLSVDQRLYKITGILEESTHNTHLRFDFLASPVERNDWIPHDYYTYLLLHDKHAADELEAHLPDFIDRHIGKELKAGGMQLKPFLQPLTEIYLHSDLEWEFSPNGDIRYVYLFLVIAFFVLLLACINFMNLSTARSVNRSNEIGIRKAVGAKRPQLTCQFLGESTLIAIIAMTVAVVLVEISLPSFNSIVERDLGFDGLKSRDVLLVLVGVVLIVGTLSGIYPALFLSAFKPVATLKNASDASKKKPRTQKSLVVAQFTISIVLVIGTGVVYDQAVFIRNKRLGFRKEQMVVVPSVGSQVMGRYRDLVSIHSAVQNASLSSTVPGREIASHFFGPRRPDAHKDVLVMNAMFVDKEFIETFGIEVVDGRAFSKDFESDRLGTFMLNQAAMRKLGWATCENKEFAHLYPESGEFRVNVHGAVVGVVKDFHYKSLHHEIEPLVIMLVDDVWIKYLSIRIRPKDVAGTLDFLKTQWGKAVPDTPFEYSFLDTSFDQLYRAEARLGMLFGGFSVLAIVVAALGLFGLASISVQQRTKEIGIRKAVGASVTNVVLLLSREYVVLVGIANLVAWPIAYYAMNRWLENFAYRVDPAIPTFVLGGLLSLSIALLTVGYKTCKAAGANPVDALRYE